jgi:ornithine cyclodeaminase
LEADTAVFTTTASTPYVHAPLRPGQLALNLSLRDLAPRGHPCGVERLRRRGALHEGQHLSAPGRAGHGRTEFVAGTLAGVLNSEVPVPDNQPVVFSPFGLGVLDLALGAYVHQQARAMGKALAVPDFFAETRRW